MDGSHDIEDYRLLTMETISTNKHDQQPANSEYCSLDAT